MNYDNTYELIKLLIECFDYKTSIHILARINQTDFYRELGKRLIGLNNEINFIKRNMNNTAKCLVWNEDCQKKSVSNEFIDIVCGIKILLQEKLSERQIVFKLLQLKMDNIRNNISNEIYIQIRDELLIEVINLRSKIYKYKAWLRNQCINFNVILDTNFMYEFGIFFDSSLKVLDCKESLFESRKIFSDIQELIAKKNLISSLKEQQKEVMMINLITPLYLKNTFSNKNIKK